MGAPAHAGGTRTPMDRGIGALAGRFVIQDRLGDGGMGEVFCAFDTTLKRPVAIKRISRTSPNDSEANQKLLREAQRACALNNPHIATVYDVVEDAGELFLVMERVEGHTLRDVMQQPISLERFYEISLQCAQAIEAAHSHNIVHGDIKPENIMITPSGDVKVLDFGVARMVRETGPTASTLASDEANSSGGTVMYMAPEVLRQQPSDTRADIFSFGVVCYELLARKHPFHDPSLAGTIDNVLHRDPPIVSSLSPSIPHKLGVVVRRAMAKDPETRYQTAAALQSDLTAAKLDMRLGPSPAPPAKHSWPVLLVLVAVVALVIWKLIPLPSTTTDVAEPMHPTIVAVLPFSAVVGDPEIQALGDGIVEEVSTRLARLTEGRALQVVPTSLLKEKGVNTVPDARQRFGIDVAVALTAARQNGNTKVTYEISNAEKGRMLAKDVIVVHAGDALTAEDAVAQATAKALALKLRPAEEGILSAHGTSVPAAYDYYLRARGYLLEYAREENVTSAILLLNEALKLDPNFGMAKAALGEAYWREYYHSKDAAWTLKAKAECDSAITLGNAAASGHMCLGLIYAGTGKYADAEQEYQRAVSLEPTDYAAYVGLASALEHQGKSQDAEQAYQRAINVRPQDWLGYNNLGNFYLRQAEYEKAIVMFQKVTTLAPESFAGYVNLAAVYNETGRFQDSIEPLKKSIAIRPTFYAYTNLGSAFFGLRDYKDASEALNKAVQLNPKSYLTWGNLGQAYHLQGKNSAASKTLQKAVGLALEELKVNPTDGVALADVAEYESILGNRTESVRYVQQALQYGHQDNAVLYSAATTYYRLGELSLSLELLNRAIQAGYSVAKIKQSPTFEPLHNDIRFQKLLAEQAK